MWPEFNRKVTRILQGQKQIENSLGTIITNYCSNKIIITTSTQLASD